MIEIKCVRLIRVIFSAVSLGKTKNKNKKTQDIFSLSTTAHDHMLKTVRVGMMISHFHTDFLICLSPTHKQSRPFPTMPRFLGCHILWFVTHTIGASIKKRILKLTKYVDRYQNHLHIKHILNKEQVDLTEVAV